MWRNSRENGGKSTVKKFWKSHEKVKSRSYTGEKKMQTI